MGLNERDGVGSNRWIGDADTVVVTQTQTL